MVQPKNFILCTLIITIISTFTPYPGTTCFAKSKKKNDVVAFKVVTSVDVQEKDIFKNWLRERLKAFADERKDFSLSDDSTKVTHTIFVYIDSLRLVDFQKYSSDLEAVDSITAKSARITSNPFLSNQASAVAQGLIIRQSYENASHPVMYARINIVDQNGKVTLKKEKEIESISTVAVSETQQLRDLFGILKTFTGDEVPYLQLE